MRISRQRHRPLNTTARLLGKPPRCPEYNPGLYSVSELDKMIFVDGYIPVANATEFDNIRTGNLEDMGAGTCWGAKYTTGLDKKYVQVLEIDFTGEPAFECFAITSSTGLKGIYDGNELKIKNIVYKAIGNGTTLIQLAGMFVQEAGSEVRNIRIDGVSFSGNARNYSCLSARMYGDALMENCIVSNCTESLVTASGVFGFGGLSCVLYGGTVKNSSVYNLDIEMVVGDAVAGVLIGLIQNTTGDATFENCHAYNCSISGVSTHTASTGTGGFAGAAIKHTYAIAFKNCDTDADIFVSGVSNKNNFGGFIGRAQNVSFEKCFASGKVDCPLGEGNGGFVGQSMGGSTYKECGALGDVLGRIAVGGFIGDVKSTCYFEDCFAQGDVTNSGSGTGGFAGYNRSGSTTYKQCYSIGSINGGAIVGGFSSNTAGAATNSYWDTETSGQATSAAGIGKTTSELQTPTSNTGIYSAWDPLIWDFGTSSEYPKLRNTP